MAFCPILCLCTHILVLFVCRSRIGEELLDMIGAQLTGVSLSCLTL